MPEQSYKIHFASSDAIVLGEVSLHVLLLCSYGYARDTYISGSFRGTGLHGFGDIKKLAVGGQLHLSMGLEDLVTGLFLGVKALTVGLKLSRKAKFSRRFSTLGPRKLGIEGVIGVGELESARIRSMTTMLTLSSYLLERRTSWGPLGINPRVHGSLKG